MRNVYKGGLKFLDMISLWKETGFEFEPLNELLSTNFLK